MPITPHQLSLWSSNMSHIYQSLEGELIRLIIKRLNNGSGNILDWQRDKLQELRLFNQDSAKLISEATGLSEKEVKRMFETSGGKIIGEIDKEMPYKTLALPTNLDTIMRAYFNQAWGNIDNYVNQTLLSTNYGHLQATTLMYNEIINKTAAAFNTGLFTFEEALERTIREWAQKGIKSTFTDKGGHTWSLERYVRTVLKSTLSNTYNQLRTDRMAEYGVYTVLVTSHMGARSECSLIQGNVADLLPNIPANSEYRSIYDPYWRADYGTAGGHRGINCRHLHVPFIPGVTTNNQPKYEAAENKEVAKLTQKQRELERRIVKFKKNRMVSEAMGNKEGVAAWQKNISTAQKAIRDLVKSNDYLARNYARERVYTPLNTLLKDFKYENEA
ncbi:phage minor capsid protein [Enterococcus termitis]